MVGARRSRGSATPTMIVETEVTSSRVRRAPVCPQSLPVNHRPARASHRGSAVTTSMTAVMALMKSTAVSPAFLSIF